MRRSTRGWFGRRAAARWYARGWSCGRRFWRRRDRSEWGDRSVGWNGDRRRWVRSGWRAPTGRFGLWGGRGCRCRRGNHGCRCMPRGWRRRRTRRRRQRSGLQKGHADSFTHARSMLIRIEWCPHGGKTSGAWTVLQMLTHTSSANEYSLPHSGHSKSVTSAGKPSSALHDVQTKTVSSAMSFVCVSFDCRPLSTSRWEHQVLHCFLPSAYVHNNPTLCQTHIKQIYISTHLFIVITVDLKPGHFKKVYNWHVAN
jgi:hypothetical protein